MTDRALPYGKVTDDAVVFRSKSKPEKGDLKKWYLKFFAKFVEKQFNMFQKFNELQENNFLNTPRQIYQTLYKQW